MIALYETLLAENPNGTDFLVGIANIELRLGVLLAKASRPQESDLAYKRAVATLKKLPADSVAGRDTLAWSLATDPESEFRDPSLAVELAKKAVELAPKDGVYWRILGAAHYRAGNWKAALAALDKSVELGFQRGSNQFFLAMTHAQMAKKGVTSQESGAREEKVALHDQDRHRDEARRWYDKAVQWMEKNVPQDEELKRFRAEAEELLETKKN